MGISDKLIIGYDLGGDDSACLSILRQEKDKYKVINSIYGSLAETSSMVQKYNINLKKEKAVIN